MVDMSSSTDTTEHFVHSGKQLIPLHGCTELSPGTLLGISSGPLLRIPLHPLGIQEPDHVHAPDATPDTASTLAASLHTPHDSPSETPEGPPSDLLGRLDHAERNSFLRLWQHVPPHVRLINFALDAPG